MHVEFLTLFMISATLVRPAVAHDGATDMVKQRMDLMSSLGRTMKSLNAMARGKSDYDGAAVQRAAEQIQRQRKQMRSLFPEGSNQMPSVARPEIWARPGEFNGLADALGAASAARAAYDGALTAFDRGDYGTALRASRPAAEQGDSGAQHVLGNLYLKGQGVTKDYDVALQWLRKSAELGFARAQNDLGMMYAEGLGVPTDYTEAMRWLHLAARQNDARALLHQGHGRAAGSCRRIALAQESRRTEPCRGAKHYRGAVFSGQSERL